VTTIDFLKRLYGYCESGWFYLWTLPDKKTYWFDINNISTVPDAAQRLLYEDQNVFYGLGLTANKKRYGRAEASNITVIPGVWVELDLQDETHPGNPETVDKWLNLIHDWPWDPSIIVHSGHGLHIYLLARESIEVTTDTASFVERFQSYIRQLYPNFKIDSTHDLARVLRLPGTVNLKSEPVPVKVIYESDARYNLDDIEQYLPDTPTKKSAGKRSDQFERRPTDGPATAVMENCIFMQKFRNPKGITEPEWMAAITNLARCVGGHEMIHELVKPYLKDKYNRIKTDKKIAHAIDGMSPQSCTFIRNTLGFTGCPPGGCDITAPSGWALTAKKRPKKKKKTVDAPLPKGMEKFTDLGNAERFARMFKGQVKYCKKFCNWLIWDGIRWKIDDSGAIMGYAAKCVRDMYHDAADIDKTEVRDALLAHAKKSEALSRMNALVTLAQHQLPVSIDDLDADHWILNVKNGTINLRTGELMAPDPANNATKLAPITYDSKATCPVFEKFIRSTFDDNQNIINFVQRFLGYCLTGDTREQQFVVAFGAGRNGKGTLLELILDMLGDYAQTTPTATIMKKKSESISNDIARLRGARYVIASEGEKDRHFDEALIKQITGQDKLAARFLYQETFEFLPQFKLVLLTNDKPVARSEDFALWERIQLLPFTKIFVGENQDKGLKTKLRAESEMSGILNWLIEGCLEWQKNGLRPPEEVVQATKEYQLENDYVENWMKDSCIVNPLAHATVSELFTNFNAWMDNSGEKMRVKRKDFTNSLEKKGFTKRVGTGNYTNFYGIGLLAEDRFNSETAKGEVVFMNQKVDPY